MGVNEETLRAAIDGLPYDLFVLDATGRYALQNAICRRRWGDVVGRYPEEVADDPGTLTTWLANNQRAFAGETVIGEVEFCLEGRTGHYFNVISPIRCQRQIAGIVGINIDITARKEAEEAARQMAATRQALAAQVIAAQEEERRRISRELHDDLGQVLFVAKMEAERLADKVADPEAREIARQLAERTRDLLGKVRQIAHRLRPPALDELGLDCALATLVQEMAGSCNATFELEVSAAAALPTSVKTAAYRIAQEALTNVVRHAEAEQVSVQATAEAGTLELRVIDDGQGFEPTEVDRTCLGLVGMRERAEALGGTLSIGEGPGGGTEVLACLPLARPSTA